MLTTILITNVDFQYWLPILTTIKEMLAQLKIIFWTPTQNLFYRGRIQLKINCANNKLTCEGGKVLLSSNFIFFLSCLSKLCSVSRSQWWADSINPDIPIYASLPWFVRSISLSCRPSSSFQCVELKCFLSDFLCNSFKPSPNDNVWAKSGLLHFVHTLANVTMQWFNHFFIILFGPEDSTGFHQSTFYIKDLQIPRRPNFGGKVWLVWPSLANFL